VDFVAGSPEDLSKLGGPGGLARAREPAELDQRHGTSLAKERKDVKGKIEFAAFDVMTARGLPFNVMPDTNRRTEVE
jgi:hypothetical protein